MGRLLAEMSGRAARSLLLGRWLTESRRWSRCSLQDVATLSPERLLLQYATQAAGTPRIVLAASSFPHLLPASSAVLWGRGHRRDALLIQSVPGDRRVSVWGRSSTAEQGPFKPKVQGSNPCALTILTK